ncbi:MAG: hypothetical protein GX096_15505 [Clostridiales bacterium]|nr:hypothetical protein [Clostridiales bacterium]
MKTNKATFRTQNLENIKTIFEERTGASLSTHAAVKPKLTLKRTFTIAIAMVLCVALGITALAASVPAVYEFLYKISPVTAQFFRPVQRVCEDNGIRMEVVSAFVHEGIAQIYISLQDLTDDRIDITTDLHNSYEIDVNEADWYGSQENTVYQDETTNVYHLYDSQISTTNYDEETKTITTLINFELEGEHAFKEDITFRLTKFLSHKQNFQDKLIDVDLSTADIAPETRTTKQTSGGFTNDSSISQSDIYLSGDELPREFVTLKPSPNPIPITDGVTLTAMGYIDGKLHIQLLYDEILRTGNQGTAYLKDSDGTIVLSSYAVAFWDDGGDSAPRYISYDYLAELGWNSYEDYVFDIAPSDIHHYTLHGDFTTCNTLTEGNWEITFPLQADDSQE